MATMNPAIKEKMFGMIEQWQQSQLPIKMFCAQHQLSNATFHYWLKKYRHGKEASAAFIPIRVKEAVAGDPFAELCLPDGRKMRFYQPLACSFIKSLLS